LKAHLSKPFTDDAIGRVVWMTWRTSVRLVDHIHVILNLFLSEIRFKLRLFFLRLLLWSHYRSFSSYRRLFLCNKSLFLLALECSLYTTQHIVNVSHYLFS